MRSLGEKKKISALLEENISKAEELPLGTELVPVVMQFQQLSQSWF